MMLLWIVIYSILGSVGAISAASVFLFLGERYRNRLIPILVSFAIGTLLSAAFLGLIPRAIENLLNKVELVMTLVLGGILIFFLVEKAILWRQCQVESCEDLPHASGPMILLGDSVHNLTDGIVITAAFLTDFSIGIAVGISVIIHEVAHETSDFGILLHAGYSKRKAFTYNVISSSITIRAALFSFFLLERVQSVVPYLLALSAAGFIYISLSDLIPALHERSNLVHISEQLIFIAAGIFLMVAIMNLDIH